MANQPCAFIGDAIANTTSAGIRPRSIMAGNSEK